MLLCYSKCYFRQGFPVFFTHNQTKAIWSVAVISEVRNIPSTGSQLSIVSRLAEARYFGLAQASSVDLATSEIK